MRRPALLLLSVLLTSVSASAAPRQARYLNFTALDRNQVYVRDLGLRDITLLLDEQPVRIRYLGHRNVSTAFVFLIENSPRTARFGKSFPHLGRVNIVDTVRSHLANGFFRPLVEIGPVQLAEFYQDLRVVHEFSRNDDELEYALHRMKLRFQGTDRTNIPVARMIGRCVDVLAARQERRKILVLFTTTVDSESYNSLQEYQSLLREGDVELYVVSFALKQPTGSGFTHQEKMNRYYFRRLAGATAGRAYVSGEYVFPEEFMDDLRSSLAETWTIGFYVEPSRPHPRPHAVRIEIAGRDVELQHRDAIVY